MVKDESPHCLLLVAGEGNPVAARGSACFDLLSDARTPVAIHPVVYTVAPKFSLNMNPNIIVKDSIQNRAQILDKFII